MSQEYFIITGPVSQWDKKNEERIQLDMGISSMSKTAGAAWYKQTRGQMEKVQYWFDRGYRLRRVRVELIEEKEE